MDESLLVWYKGTAVDIARILRKVLPTVGRTPTVGPPGPSFSSVSDWPFFFFT